MRRHIGEQLLDKSYLFMDALTKKWWLYLIFVLVVFIPPLTSVGFAAISDIVPLVRYVADILVINKEKFVSLMPVSHFAIVLLFILLAIFMNKLGRVFSIIVGAHMIFLMCLQAGAITQKYGWVVYPNGIILFSIIALVWIWEALVRRTDFSFNKLSVKHVWLLVFALFAFWNPDKMGDFRLSLFLTSTSPIAFCMMSTIYITILCLLYPKVNMPLLRIMSFIVILVSLVAISLGFFFENKNEGMYWSFLHLPMFIISGYGFWLGMAKKGYFTSLLDEFLSCLFHQPI
jgi:hypothetical protein